MSKVLTTTDIRLGSAWLNVSLTPWKMLRASWESRKSYLEQDGALEQALTDLFYRQAGEVLALQGVAMVREEAWERYRRAGYSLAALLAEEVLPSVEAGHARIMGFGQALSEAYRLGVAKAAFDARTLQGLLEKAFQAQGDTVQAVASQSLLLDSLFKALEENLQTGVSGITLAAWAHHMLTQIRPYSDGNARVAFLLTNYILGREGAAPLLLWREQRYAYYEALQKADQGSITEWQALFLRGMQQSVLYLLSWGYPHSYSFEEALHIYNRRHQHWRSQQNRDRSQTIMNNRYTVFDYVEEILGQIANELGRQNENGESLGIKALVAKAYPDSPYYYQFTGEVSAYAKEHRYVFNRSLPRGWFKLKFYLSANKRCQLVLPIHHVGHDDATLAVGALLHYLEPLKYQRKRRMGRRRHPQQKERAVYLFAPLPLKQGPLAFNIAEDVATARPLLESYIRETLRSALIELANQIY
jgi:hypothetical protein